MSNRERLQRSLQNIRGQLSSLESQLQEAIAMEAVLLDLPTINAILREMADQSSRQRILSVYLEGVTSLGERGILFSRESGRLVPRKAVGFDLETLPILSLEQQENMLVQSVLTQQIVLAGQDAKRDFPWAAEDEGLGQWACCLPLILDDSVPLVAYADSRRPLPVDALELLTQLVILVLKNHELRRRLASPPGDGRSTEQSEVSDREEVTPPARVEG